jgi:hypothetical protein
MTAICISIPSYSTYQEYQRLNKVERLTLLKEEVRKEMHEFLSFADTPRRMSTAEENKKHTIDLNERSNRVKVLQKECSELEKELAQHMETKAASK